MNRSLTKIDKKFEVLEIVCNSQAPKVYILDSNASTVISIIKRMYMHKTVI